MAASDAVKVAENVLGAMGINATVVVESEEPLHLMIDCADSALLIGKGGENLRALQHVMNAMYKKDFPEGDFVSIDIAGYKKERIERVQAAAQEAAEKVRAEDSTVHLSPMNSFERRHVHTLLAGEADIVTESEGDGLNRHVVIKKRS